VRKGAGAWLARFRLLTGIIVVVSASVMVAWGLRRYLRSSPRFAIKTVIVEGNARRAAHQVATRAGAELGQNIFAFDLQLARRGVEADDWVESAAVTRELPNTVRIEVSEREVRALAAVGGQLLLVDSKGNLFKKLKPGDPSDLPVITGVAPAQLAHDLAGVTQRLRRVLDLLADFERAGIAKRFPIQEVRLEPDDSLMVTLGSDGIAVALGRPPYRGKVDKVDRILVEVRRRKAKPAVVFLDDEAHPERVVVRMR
jgi:cell division protein FtsQ